MGFFDRIRKKPSAPVQTPAERRITVGGQVTRPGANIIVQQPMRFNLDLGVFKQAIRSAENVDYTRRVQLYDIYTEAMLDPHLMSVIRKRKSAILGSPIEFRRSGVPDESINTQIESPWFYRFISDLLDAQFWGFTMVQFYIDERGWIDYTLVPRKHVDPQLNLIRRHQSDTVGIPFSEYDNLLMVSGSDPLGLLACCCPYTIYKRGTVGDWAEFSEIFGMPIQEYIYDATDEDSRQRTIADIMANGSNRVFVHADDNTFKFVEAGNKTGSADVYDKLVERCNAELSKAILGNTLTTEASETGTQALGTVHKEVEDELAKDDRRFILNVLNYDMTDIFRGLGINTDGGAFCFVEPEKMSAAEKADLFKKAIDMGLPIDDDYMYEQLGIEKPADYSSLKQEQSDRRERQLEALRQVKESPENRLTRFFVDAPQYGALEW